MVMDISDFHRDGFVVLRGFIDLEVIAGVRTEMEQYVDALAARMLAEGRADELFENEPWETRLWRLFGKDLDAAPQVIRKELHLAGMYPLFFHDGILDVVEKSWVPRCAFTRIIQFVRNCQNTQALWCYGTRMRVIPSRYTATRKAT